MKERTYVDDVDRSVYDIKDEENDAYRIKSGLDASIVEKISKEKNDPVWMQNFRLQSLQIYNELKVPNRPLTDLIWTILQPMFVRTQG